MPRKNIIALLFSLVLISILPASAKPITPQAAPGNDNFTNAAGITWVST